MIGLIKSDVSKIRLLSFYGIFQLGFADKTWGNLNLERGEPVKRLIELPVLKDKPGISTRIVPVSTGPESLCC